ncbi:hypothetical protein R3P38DRAFT_3567162 [Favolaschia claudopus]|uniref:Uncharacterized protein n=1 Tax=Favolaschia claudopus TaxID=2862362 RepID=A0AAW0AT18_9AGAR
MATVRRVLPDGLTVSTLLSAKGAQLKFWTTQTNASAEEKVLKISGTVDQLRTNLAAYYGLDLTVIPRAHEVTVPTIDESIRDRQWADFVALGAEWKSTVEAGKVFHLLTSSIRSTPPASTDSTGGAHQEDIHPITLPADNLSAHAHDSNITSASTGHDLHSPDTNTPASLHEAALLHNLSQVVEGLERCEGLRDIVEQVESGKVAEIRARYGPAEGRRGTADAAWPRFRNIVSKRERLYRILKEEFSGDKERFFSFFSVSSVTKKRKRPQDEPVAPEERFRSFRKIVEAAPWCEADVLAERQKEQYYGADGEFCRTLWDERWGAMNLWEVWRSMEKEHYEKKKDSI